jgi:hypothetical protein
MASPRPTGHTDLPHVPCREPVEVIRADRADRPQASETDRDGSVLALAVVASDVESSAIAGAHLGGRAHNAPAGSCPRTTGITPGHRVIYRLHGATERRPTTFGCRLPVAGECRSADMACSASAADIATGSLSHKAVDSARSVSRNVRTSCDTTNRRRSFTTAKSWHPTRAATTKHFGPSRRQNPALDDRSSGSLERLQQTAPYPRSTRAQRRARARPRPRRETRDGTTVDASTASATRSATAAQQWRRSRRHRCAPCLARRSPGRSRRSLGIPHGRRPRRRFRHRISGPRRPHVEGF